MSDVLSNDEIVECLRRIGAIARAADPPDAVKALYGTEVLRALLAEKLDLYAEARRKANDPAGPLLEQAKEMIAAGRAMAGLPPAGLKYALICPDQEHPPENGVFVSRSEWKDSPRALLEYVHSTLGMTVSPPDPMTPITVSGRCCAECPRGVHNLIGSTPKGRGEIPPKADAQST